MNVFNKVCYPSGFRKRLALFVTLHIYIQTQAAEMLIEFLSKDRTAPASHRVGAGSSPGQSMYDFCCRYYCTVALCTHIIWGWTIVPLVASHPNDVNKSKGRTDVPTLSLTVYIHTWIESEWAWSAPELNTHIFIYRFILFFYFFGSSSYLTSKNNLRCCGIIFV
jgi:hypothetical protein